MAVVNRSRRRLVLILALIAFIASGLVGGKLALDWWKDRKVRLATERGLDAFQAGDFESTVQLLGPLARSSSDDPEVMRALALALVRTDPGDDSVISRAMPVLARAHGLDPSDPELTAKLLDAYFRLGYTREALDLSRGVLAQDPTNRAAANVEIEVSAAMGRWEDAVESSRRLVVLDPDDHQAKQRYLQLQLASSIPVEAVLQSFIDMPAGKTEDGLDDVILGTLLSMAGRSGEAAERIEGGADRGAASLGRLEAMVSILSDLGRSDLVRKLYLNELEQDSALDRVQLAAAAVDWGYNRSERTFLLELLDLLSDTPQARDRALIALASPSRPAVESIPDAVQVEIARSEASPSGSSGVRAAMLAREVIEQHDETRYRELLELLSPVPEHSPLIIAGLQAAVAYGDFARAEQFAELLEGMPSSLPAQLALTDLDSARGRQRRAVGRILAQLEAYPNWVGPLLQLADLWIAGGSLSSLERSRLQASTGIQNLEGLIDRLERAGVDAGLLALTRVQLGLSDDPEADLQGVLETSLESGTDSTPTLLRVHRLAIRNAPALVGPTLDYLIERASGDPMVIAATILSDDSARAITEMLTRLPLADADRRTRESAWMALLQNLGVADGDEFAAVVELALARSDLPASTYRVLLFQNRIWENRDWCRTIIDRLLALGNASDDETAAWEATWVLVHASDQPERIRAAIRDLNERVSTSDGSYGVGLTLLRLLMLDPSAELDTTVRVGVRLLGDNPEQVELYPIVIDLLRRVGRVEDAESLLVEFESLDASGVASRRQRAALEYETGNFDRLAATLAQLTAQTNSAQDLLNLGLAREAVGDLIGAESVYRELLSDSRTQPDTLGVVTSRLAGLLAQLGRTSELEPLIQTASGTLGETQLAVLTAGALIETGEIERAVGTLESAILSQPANIVLLRVLSEAYARQGNWAASIRAVMNASKLRDGTGEVAVRIVNLALEQPQAAREFQSACERDEAIPELLRDCASVIQAASSANGKIEPDLADLDRCAALVSKHPDSLAAYSVAVSLCSLAGDMTRIGGFADAARLRFPGEPLPCEWKVMIEAAVGDLDGARTACLEWRRLRFPDVFEVDTMLAGIEIARRRPDVVPEILGRYRDVIVRGRQDRPGPFRNLVAASLMTGKVSEAIALVGDDLRNDPATRELWLRAACMAPYQPGLDAMSVYEAQSGADPVSRVLLVGDWLGFHERHPEGQGLERARSLVPVPLPSFDDKFSRVAGIAAGQIAIAAGDPVGGVRLYQAVIDSIPTDIQQRALAMSTLPLPAQQEMFAEIEPLLYAKNNLAMLRAASGESLEAALTDIDWCLAVMPSVPELHDTRAQVLLRLRRYSEAEQSAMTAIRQRPGVVDQLITGVEILAATNRQEEARNLLRQINLKLASEPWTSPTVLQRVQQVSESLGGV